MICVLKRAATASGKNWVFLQHLYSAEEPGIICKIETLPEAAVPRAIKLFWAGAHHLVDENTEFGISPDDFLEEPVDPAF
jgi:hypothetical protein